MRYFEPTAALLCIQILIQNFYEYEYGESKLWLSFPYIIMVLLTYFGARYEGLRLAQFIYLTGFFFSSIWMLMELFFEFSSSFQYTMNIVFLVFFLYYCYFGFTAGWGNLNRVVTTGRYMVGTRIIRTETLGTQVLVYYPISFLEYERNKEFNLPFHLNENIDFFIEGSKIAGIPGWLARSIYSIDTDTTNNGQLISDFEGKAMVPIIFSHGYGMASMLYSVTCRELASYGYMVFSVGHQDRSAPYVSKSSGEAIYFNADSPIDDLPAKRDQLEIRVNEILNLRKDLSNMTEDSDTYQQIFGQAENCSLDFDRLVLAGHSFGGMTAIQAASILTDTQCHACLTMDPWLEPQADAIQDGTLLVDTAIQILATSEFMSMTEAPFSQTASLYQTFMNQSTSLVKEQVTFKPMAHLEQSDLVYTSPFLVRLQYGRKPAEDLNMICAQKMILFLNHIDIIEDKYVPDEYISKIYENVDAARQEGKIENVIEFLEIMIVILQ